MDRAPRAAGDAGIGLRAPHYAEILERRPPLGLVEVHSENFFAAAGAPLAWLERFREAYPLSVHGVGLSLGSADGVDERHLAKLAALVERFEPRLISEHLSWSAIAGRHANDLLPLPFTEEAIAVAVASIGRVQERLGRTLLVENVSSYASFPESTLPEWEFLAEVVRRSGCGVLLDVNNVFVNAANHGFDPHRYIDAIDASRVGEIHLAGHESRDGLLVDTHARRVSPEVWELFEYTVERMGARPAVVEWDADIPALDVLLEEAARAGAIQSLPQKGPRMAREPIAT